MKLLQMNITFLLTVFLLAASIQAQDSTEAPSQSPVNQTQDSTDAPFSLDRALLSVVLSEREVITTVRDLLNYGANVHTTTDDGNTPLHLAAQMGHATITRMLLEKEADANAINSAGETPLHIAVLEGHADLIWPLLAHGARMPNADSPIYDRFFALLGIYPRDDGSSPLHLAAQIGNATIARMLLEKGADANAVNSVGETPLYFATGHISAAERLKDDFEQTLLYYQTFKRRHADVAWLLLDHGAKVPHADSPIYDRMFTLLRNYPRQEAVELIPIPSRDR